MFWSKPAFDDQNPNIAFWTRHNENKRTWWKLIVYEKENFNRLTDFKKEAIEYWDQLLKIHRKEL